MFRVLNYVQQRSHFLDGPVETPPMAQLLFLISALPALALLTLAAVLPRSLANRSPLAVRRWVSRIATLQLGVALLISIAAVAGQRLGPVALGLTDQPSASDSVAAFLMTQVYLDGVSALMFLMVSFIGWVICRYSIRYLDGDASQGNFFRWTGFTLGAVSLMVISGDLAYSL